MKKCVKQITVLGMVGVMLLTGCGSTQNDSIAEAPADNGGYEAEGQEPAGALPAQDTYEAPAADEAAEAPAATEEAEAADEAPADVYNSTEIADDWAKEAERDGAATKGELSEGYLGSCYEFDEELPDNSGEEYSEWEEKGFSSVMAQPLSTFAADVDTASYSNLRRLITEGYDLESLPEGAVRIEEMINYFSYDYNDPIGNDPFGVTTQIGRCPWNDEAELLMIGLKTQDIDYSHAPASNLVFRVPCIRMISCLFYRNLSACWQKI